MNKQLKDYTDVELKALAYDVIANIERQQENLKIINQELASRKQPGVTETPEEVKEEVKEDVDNK